MAAGTTGSGAGAGDGTREPARLEGRDWTALVVLTVSTFIVMLDATVVVIALPAIVQDLGGSLDEATWIIAAFILSFAALLLLCGKLADIYGRRLLLVTGIAVFTLASLACAFAPSVEFLIVGRALQGAGAAMMEPTVLALIKATFPRERLGLAFGIQGIAAGVAASLGPTLGGLITTAFSWEYIFLLNLPVGVLAIVGVLLTVRESRAEGMARQLDVPGLIFSGTGVFFLVFAIIEGERFGWGSAVIVGSFVASAALLGLFVLTELRVRRPMIDLSIFKDRLFAVGNILRGTVEFVILGTFFPLALFFQFQLNYSPLQTGLQLLPLVVVSFFVSPLAGGISDKVDFRWIVVPALLVAAGGTYWLANVTPESSWTFFIGPLAVLGIGVGALYPPTTSATLSDVPAAQSGVAAGVSYTAFLLGSELGLAVVGALLQNRFVANLEDALAGAPLPPDLVESITSSLSEGGVRLGDGGGSVGGPQVEGLIEHAFADAVNTALLACVGVAVLGAVLALFLSSGKPRHPALRTDGFEAHPSQHVELSGHRDDG